MKFEIEENAGSNFFILCTEEEYTKWLNGQYVFVKDPLMLNDLFKKYSVNVKIERDSFLPSFHLNTLPAQSCLSEFFPELADSLKKYSPLSLLDVWEIYNDIISKNNPYRKHTIFSNIVSKTYNSSLYRIIKNFESSHIRFFGEKFSIYSILTMRPKYYDDEDLNLNIFHKKLNDQEVYCLSWTEGY